MNNKNCPDCKELVKLYKDYIPLDWIRGCEVHDPNMYGAGTSNQAVEIAKQHGTPIF